jgi:hypothetical protein
VSGSGRPTAGPGRHPQRRPRCRGRFQTPNRSPRGPAAG